MVNKGTKMSIAFLFSSKWAFELNEPFESLNLQGLTLKKPCLKRFLNLRHFALNSKRLLSTFSCLNCLLLALAQTLFKKRRDYSAKELKKILKVRLNLNFLQICVN